MMPLTTPTSPRPRVFQPGCSATFTPASSRTFGNQVSENAMELLHCGLFCRPRAPQRAGLLPAPGPWRRFDAAFSGRQVGIGSRFARGEVDVAAVDLAFLVDASVHRGASLDARGGARFGTGPRALRGAFSACSFGPASCSSACVLRHSGAS